MKKLLLLAGLLSLSAAAQDVKDPRWLQRGALDGGTWQGPPVVHVAGCSAVGGPSDAGVLPDGWWVKPDQLVTIGQQVAQLQMDNVSLKNQVEAKQNLGLLKVALAIGFGVLLGGGAVITYDLMIYKRL